MAILPSKLTVFGVFNILLGLGHGVLACIALSSMNSHYDTPWVGLAVVILIWSVVQFVTGIGLVRYRQWARMTMLFLCFLALVGWGILVYEVSRHDAVFMWRMGMLVTGSGY